MDTKKMAQFISDLRKSHNMTQKALAEKLNVTDKAVSKWERGLSCPDVSILAPLADILGVTISELLMGEKSNTTNESIETAVEATLQYTEKAKKSKSKNIQSLCRLAISALLFLGIITCAICDLAISKSFSWSLYPIASCIFTWLSIFPILKFGKKGICISLAVFSVLLIPFLFVLNSLIGEYELFMLIGIRVSIISLIYLWIVFILFSKIIKKKFTASAISALLAIPVSFLINYTVSKFTQEPLIDVWDIISYSVLFILAIVFFSIKDFSRNT